MKKLSKPVLELSGISKSDKKSTVEALSLSVQSGDCFALLYKSDAAADLLTEILSGRIAPKKGKIFFKSDDVTGTKNVFGVVEKKRRAPKRQTVAEVASAPVVKRGLSRSMTDVLVRKELQGFGLSELADESFSHLSDQASERAMIFAAYMCSHELIVINEPFAALPPEEREGELQWLDSIRRERGMTMLVLTKSEDVALTLSDYVMVADESMSSMGIVSVQKGSEDKARQQIRGLRGSD